MKICFEVKIFANFYPWKRPNDSLHDNVGIIATKIRSSKQFWVKNHNIILNFFFICLFTKMKKNAHGRVYLVLTHLLLLLILFILINFGIHIFFHRQTPFKWPFCCNIMIKQDGHSSNWWIIQVINILK